MEAGEAAARHAITYMKATEGSPGDFTAGTRVLAKWLQEHPDSPHASPLALFLAHVYDVYLKDPAQALQYYQQADRAGFQNQGQAGSKYWRMAELARQLDNVPDAVRYCQQIILHYSRSGRAYEALIMLRELQAAHPELNITLPELKSFDALELQS
jgi:hypothetical protein